MKTTHLANELASLWHPLDHTVQGLRQEFRSFEHTAATFLVELEEMQNLLLEKAVECETLQREVFRQNDEKLRWLSRFEQQEAQLVQATDEIAKLRAAYENAPRVETVVSASVNSGTSFEEQRYQLEIEQLRRELTQSQAEKERLTHEMEEMREERGRWAVELEYQQREYETLAAQRDQLEQLQQAQEQRINDELLSLQNMVQSLVQRSHAEPRDRHANHHEAPEQEAATADHGSKPINTLAASLQAQFARIKKDSDRRRGRT
jgi:seryl-tRNA synthetase